MKGGHRGRLVDVSSLRVSVVDGHGRVEGGEELRRSCKKKENKYKTFLFHFAVSCERLI